VSSAHLSADRERWQIVLDVGLRIAQTTADQSRNRGADVQRHDEPLIADLLRAGR
jgi:hypothetical protein